jgi:hypothetical protein
MTRPKSRVRRGQSRPAFPSLGGSGGVWMIPLFGRSALQLIENQFAMLLECAEALFERMEH